MTQRFAGFRLVFAVVALALWAGDAANAQVERTPTAENVMRNVKRNSIAAPKVAPRQASEAPVAASRGGARAARVGGTGGDSARSVDNGRTSAGQESIVSNIDCGAVPVVDANELACCLKTCREELHVCVVGDHVSCIADARTPIQCFKEFKCCLDACFPGCEPSNCGGDCTILEGDCTSYPDVCCSGLQCCADMCVPEGDCCVDGDCPSEDNTIQKCCQGSCIPDDDCCVDDDCDAEENENCCSGTCQKDACCAVDSDCGDGEFCCDAKCSDCACGSDTCFAKDISDDISCCFITNTCGAVTGTKFNRWGWTNGPYALPTEPLTIELKVWCGAGQCITGSGFEGGTFTIVWDPLDALSDIATLSATWSGGTSGWTLHLGCGGLEPYPSFTAGQNTKYTVAPGKYEFDGSGTTPLVLTANEWPEVTTCVGLYVIAHFCSVE